MQVAKDWTLEEAAEKFPVSTVVKHKDLSDEDKIPGVVIDHVEYPADQMVRLVVGWNDPEYPGLVTEVDPENVEISTY